MSSVIVRKLDSLRRSGAMNITDVANILGTTPATVSRWNNGKASPQRAKELLLVELEYIVDRLQEFYTPEEARLWIFARHRLLQDRKPADLIQEGDIEPVLAAIEQLSDLVYI